MRYKVVQKTQARQGWKFMLYADGDLNYTAVGKDDFDRVQVGDTIEMLITVVPKGASDAKS